MAARKTTKSELSPNRVRVLYKGVEAALDTRDASEKKVGNAQYGVYAFFDYDGEPIYVGQTTESLRTRIRRHLTNQRTDAAAMRVLDPYEVAEIEMWPFWDISSKAEAKEILNRAEYTVYQMAIENSEFKAVLNEKEPEESEAIALPQSTRVPIVPEDLRRELSHPDTRMARRAQTIAELARIISERQVQPGLRKTLLVQAQRLERLASERYKEVRGESGGDPEDS